MPATRRARTSGGGPAMKGAQKTLSFSSSKISKSTSTKDKFTPQPTEKVISTSVPAPSDIEQAEVEDVKLEEELPVKIKAERSAEEIKAAKVTDAQIRRYWQKRQSERTAPRVHQEDLTVEEKVLRLWDMSSQYGPAMGITRKKRWQRANKLGLAPPIEVLAVLVKEEERGNEKIERAYVDELMSSKFPAET